MSHSDTESPTEAERITQPPVEEDALSLMRDLRGALANVGELITKLDLRLCQTMLATATVEHKVNQLREEFDQHVGEAAE